ncbi:MAG: lysophospholipid acyltransferase family protein [Cellvibrionaceae bacterium]
MSSTIESPPVPFKERFAVGLLKASACLPLGVSRVIGAMVGQIAYWMKGRMYKVTEENLSLCFPQMPMAERQALVRNSLIETSKTMMETGAVWLRDYHWVKSHIRQVYGHEILQDAIDDDRGVILLAPHLGNWEVLGLYVAEFTDLTCLYKPQDMTTLEPIIRNSRERAGAKVVPTNRKGVVRLLKVMKSGGFTAILPDQIPDTSGGAFAPFYGVPALTMTLVNNLRERSDCLVLAAYAKRVPSGFDIHIKHADEQIDSSDEAEALAALNRTVESCVNDIPEQYQWEYKRFRKQPQGLPKRYKK